MLLGLRQAKTPKNLELWWPEEAAPIQQKLPAVAAPCVVVAGVQGLAQKMEIVEPVSLIGGMTRGDVGW